MFMGRPTFSTLTRYWNGRMIPWTFTIVNTVINNPASSHYTIFSQNGKDEFDKWSSKWKVSLIWPLSPSRYENVNLWNFIRCIFWRMLLTEQLNNFLFYWIIYKFPSMNGSSVYSSATVYNLQISIELRYRSATWISILMLRRLHDRETGGMDRFGIGEKAGESDVMQEMMGERERERWAEVFGRNTEREGGREQMTNWDE